MEGAFQLSVEKELSNFLETSVSISTWVPQSGGSINRAFHLQSNKGSFFIKINGASKYPKMFEREFEGLEMLRASSELAIPKPLLVGKIEDEAFLILEWIEKGKAQTAFWHDFGLGLANLHRQTNDQFGLDADNYIGSLAQVNAWRSSWAEFFVLNRLEPLAKMARDAGELDGNMSGMLDKLYAKMDSLFPVESPALIHGDLWSGNFSVNSNGNPVIFDPAVYYGHREMDLAMSKLFGGFDSKFYDTYQEVYPMEVGWEERVDICNLYPLLVHVILFGGSYLQDLRSITKRMVG